MEGLEKEASEYEGEPSVEVKKPKRQRQPKGEKKPKAKKELANPNVIKTSNRLVGEIENKDLYASDDDGLVQEVADPLAFSSVVGEELDLGVRPPREKKEVDSLLKKLSFNKKNSIE